MFDLVKSVALKMMDEKTQEGNLMYVVALMVFFLVIVIIDKITDDKLDKLFKFGRYILLLLALYRIPSLISTFFKEGEKKSVNKKVSASELAGLYKGSIQPLSSKNSKNIAVNVSECRLGIEKNLNCILYSERDTTEQLLGSISTINDPVSSILIPKLGWAICEKTDNIIILHNDTSINKNYYFNFIRNENK